MRKMKAAEIILDFDLYPRNNVDSHNVNNIVDAIRAGVQLPPVVICKKSKRAADGFHRVKAVLKIDPEGEIEVIEKTYKDDAALFADAMRYNSSHGAKLDTCDRIHCLIVADRLHIPRDMVAGALNMPANKLEELRVHRTAIGESSRLTVPIKRTIQHMAGKKLTKAQEGVNDRSSGMNQAFYVNQLIDLIEAELLNKSDDNLMDRLRHLHELLDGVLVA